MRETRSRSNPDAASAVLLIALAACAGTRRSGASSVASSEPRAEPLPDAAIAASRVERVPSSVESVSVAPQVVFAPSSTPGDAASAPADGCAETDPDRAMAASTRFNRWSLDAALSRAGLAEISLPVLRVPAGLEPRIPGAAVTVRGRSVVVLDLEPADSAAEGTTRVAESQWGLLGRGPDGSLTVVEKIGVPRCVRSLRVRRCPPTEGHGGALRRDLPISAVRLSVVLGFETGSPPHARVRVEYPISAISLAIERDLCPAPP